MNTNKKFAPQNVTKREVTMGGHFYLSKTQTNNRTIES